MPTLYDHRGALCYPRREWGRAHMAAVVDLWRPIFSRLAPAAAREDFARRDTAASSPDATVST